MDTGNKLVTMFYEIFCFRLIVRISDLLPLRGTVLEDSIPALKSEKIKTIPTKEVLEFCFPELQLSRLASQFFWNHTLVTDDISMI